MSLVEVTRKGLYCRLADLYIDPWRAVPKALITHAHADHACGGHSLYLAHEQCVPILQSRLGRIRAQGFSYGTTFYSNGVRISFHPAGHVPGSAQIRLECHGEVWVVSGDYKLEEDGVCTPFEPLRCHTFITESTFGLPIYRWKPQAQVFNAMNNWWAENARDGVVSVVLAYSLGKAQRILQHLDQQTGPVIVHPAMEEMNTVIRSFFPSLPQTLSLKNELSLAGMRNALLILPPNAKTTEWLDELKPYRTAFASGWMNLRNGRNRNAMERGFVLSDHADWPGLLAAVEATAAEKIYVTHGYSKSFVRWLKEEGKDAEVLETLFSREEDASEEKVMQ